MRTAFPVLLLASLALLAGCGGAEEAIPGPRPPLVEAVQARSGSLPLEENVHGVLRAENQVSVRPEVEAVVAEVLVKSGQAVERGQVLVRLRDEELREQLSQGEAEVRLAEASAAQARARVDELEARLRRTRELAKDELVSELELETQEAQWAAARATADATEARVDESRATVEERRSALAKTRVRSPVSGRVGERNAELGMLVDSSTVLFRVGNLSRLIVEVPLTEAMLGHLEEGQPVTVRARGSDQESIEATLSRISPFLDEESFTTVGEIDLGNPEGRLRPGMFVTVRIFYGTTQVATLVPASALWEDPATGERGVFAVEDATGLEAPAGAAGEASEEGRPVAFRSVAILAEGRGTVGVSGIAQGEWVVISGQHLLRRVLQDEANEVAQARVRPIAWERVQELQALQREDLLEGFLAKQQKLAKVLGAEIPESESVVEQVLAEGDPGEGATAAGGS